MRGTADGSGTSSVIAKGGFRSLLRSKSSSGFGDQFGVPGVERCAEFALQNCGQIPERDLLGLVLRLRDKLLTFPAMEEVKQDQRFVAGERNCYAGF